VAAARRYAVLRQNNTRLFMPLKNGVNYRLDLKPESVVLVTKMTNKPKRIDASVSYNGECSQWLQQYLQSSLILAGRIAGESGI
jgi:hypothetical protein